MDSAMVELFRPFSRLCKDPRMPVSTKAGVACLCGGVFLYQTVLPALVRCLLAGRSREREWPGAREEGEGGCCREAVDNC